MPERRFTNFLHVLDFSMLVGVEDVTRLTFVRHGEQAFDRRGPNGEMIDQPLSERGLLQAKATAERLADEQVDAIYASPIRRAAETAAPIAESHGMEPIVLPGLREIELFRHAPRGEERAAFMTGDEMLAAYERLPGDWRWDHVPGTEPSAEFRERAVAAVEEIVEAEPGRRVIVVCHGGTINAYLCHILGIPTDMIFRPANASITVVHAGHGLRVLQSLNDVGHLPAGEGGLVTY